MLCLNGESNTQGLILGITWTNSYLWRASDQQLKLDQTPRLCGTNTHWESLCKLLGRFCWVSFLCTRGTFSFAQQWTCVTAGVFPDRGGGDEMWWTVLRFHTSLSLSYFIYDVVVENLMYYTVNLINIHVASGEYEEEREGLHLCFFLQFSYWYCLLTADLLCFCFSCAHIRLHWPFIILVLCFVYDLLCFYCCRALWSTEVDFLKSA